jgi:hypothetical protein
MAGVKITDLGILTTAVDADLLYIVDVSDTSQSPQGTSKQIEVGNMFPSGTWTPTINTNYDAVTVDSAIYSVTGNVVSFTLYNVDINNNTSALLDGFASFTPPSGLDISTIGACFNVTSFINDFIDSGPDTSVFLDSGLIKLQITNSVTEFDKIKGTIQGQYTLS